MTCCDRGNQALGVDRFSMLAYCYVSLLRTVVDKESSRSKVPILTWVCDAWV